MRVLELHQPCDFDPSTGEATADRKATRCQGCGSTVHDLSSMTAEEASAFLDARRPGQCLTFERGADERIVFADGPGAMVGRIARDARPMVVVASLLLAACERGEQGDAQRKDIVQPEPPVAVQEPPKPTAAPTAPADEAPAPSASCVPQQELVMEEGAPDGGPTKTHPGNHAALPAAKHAPPMPVMRLTGI